MSPEVHNVTSDIPARKGNEIGAFDKNRSAKHHNRALSTAEEKMK